MNAEEHALLAELTKRLRMAVELVAGEYHPSPDAVSSWLSESRRALRAAGDAAKQWENVCAS